MERPTEIQLRLADQKIGVVVAGLNTYLSDLRTYLKTNPAPIVAKAIEEDIKTVTEVINSIHIALRLATQLRVEGRVRMICQNTGALPVRNETDEEEQDREDSSILPVEPDHDDEHDPYARWYRIDAAGGYYYE